MAETARGGVRLKTEEKIEDTTGRGKREKIKIMAGQLGGDAPTMEIDKGTTPGDIIQAKDWAQFEVRVDGEEQKNNYVLKEGQIVIAVPTAVTGGL